MAYAYWEMNYDNLWPHNLPESWHVIDLINFKERDLKSVNKDPERHKKQYPTYQWRRFVVIQFGNRQGYISEEKRNQFPGIAIGKSHE